MKAWTARELPLSLIMRTSAKIHILGSQLLL
jgi:hypothetical protein